MRRSKAISHRKAFGWTEWPFPSCISDWKTLNHRRLPFPFVRDHPIEFRIRAIGAKDGNKSMAWECGPWHRERYRRIKGWWQQSLFDIASTRKRREKLKQWKEQNHSRQCKKIIRGIGHFNGTTSGFAISIELKHFGTTETAWSTAFSAEFTISKDAVQMKARGPQKEKATNIGFYISNTWTALLHQGKRKWNEKTRSCRQHITQAQQDYETSLKHVLVGCGWALSSVEWGVAGHEMRAPVPHGILQKWEL